ncbi:diguanylate cyclase [Massilia sp. UMI-21]|nr:diguanylate cyclase [Massilia sp. UMI-21]
MSISPYHGAGGAPRDDAYGLQQLQAGLAASAALSQRLGAGGGRPLCERIGALLHELTHAEHSFVALRTSGPPEACAYLHRAVPPFGAGDLADAAERLLERLGPGTIATRTVRGTRFLAAALTADGIEVLGALCFAVRDGSAVDAAFDTAALLRLAEQGALRLAAQARAGRSAGQAAGARDSRDPWRLPEAGTELGLLRTLVDNMPDYIYAKDRNGRFVFANRAAAIGILGSYDLPALIGKSDLDFYPLACGQRFFTDEQTIIRSGQPIIDQVEENLSKDGTLRYFSTTKLPFYNQDGAAAGIVGISRDISARVGADEVARIRDRAVESSQDGILITSAAGEDHPVIYSNPAFERLTGFGTAEARRCGIERFLREPMQAGPAGGGQQPAERGALIAGHGQQRVLRCVRRDGSAFWCEVRLATICAPDGRATHHVFTFIDVTAAHAAEAELIQLAGHDALTGLPNRRMLMARLDSELHAGAAGKPGLAVAFIDLDGLKRLNDEHGHEAGDVLLRAVADRISRRIRKSDMIARLGGDEFVLVSLHGGGVCSPDEVREFLGKVMDGIAQPLAVAGTTVMPSCSIGVSLYGTHGADGETLLRRADAAMYSAKRCGPGRIAFADAA